MPNILKEVRVLQEEGKLHRRLITRTRLYLGISFLLLCVTLYYIYLGANPLLSIALAALGLLAGYFIFSKMMRVQWNDTTEQVESASMGTLGYSLIGLYILFEIAARTVLGSLLGSGAEGYIIALIFGVILGRTSGVIVEIHRVYRSTH